MPKSYKYKNDTSKKLHYGLIAQEFEQLYPELISMTTMNGNAVKGINYLELIPILIGKIKLMEKEIEELKAKNL